MAKKPPQSPPPKTPPPTTKAGFFDGAFEIPDPLQAMADVVSGKVFEGAKAVADAVTETSETPDETSETNGKPDPETPSDPKSGKSGDGKVTIEHVFVRRSKKPPVGTAAPAGKTGEQGGKAAGDEE